MKQWLTNYGPWANVGLLSILSAHSPIPSFTCKDPRSQGNIINDDESGLESRAICLFLMSSSHRDVSTVSPLVEHCFKMILKSVTLSIGQYSEGVFCE